MKLGRGATWRPLDRQVSGHSTRNTAGPSSTLASERGGPQRTARRSRPVRGRRVFRQLHRAKAIAVRGLSSL